MNLEKICHVSFPPLFKLGYAHSMEFIHDYVLNFGECHDHLAQASASIFWETWQKILLKTC